MINLPKLSPLSARGNADEKIKYLINYIQSLTVDIERILSGMNKTQTQKTVIDIKWSSDNAGAITVVYSDGSTKYIKIS